jgi:hypothetical protein
MNEEDLALGLFFCSEISIEERRVKDHGKAKGY